MLNPAQSSQIEYEIHTPLGEGLNSWVYKASRKTASGLLNEEVALKVFKSKTSDHILKKEYRSLAAVHSAYCVRVFGFEMVEGHPALVLEYIDGVSLLDLALSCNLTARHLMTILSQVIKGLHDLHSQGFFHGDLSPGNILVDTHGRVKLIDFGLSNLASGGHVYGTPEFIDPKVLKGHPMSPSSDLFSLDEVFRFCSKFISTSRVPQREFHRLRSPGKFQNFENYESEGDLRSLSELVRSKGKSAAAHGVTAALSIVELDAAAAKKPRFYTAIAAMLVIGLFLPISSINSNSMISSLAIVKVRTSKWYQLKINSREVGYTPLTLPVEAGTVYIEWRQNNRQGRRALTIRAGENIVLNDSFFTSSLK